MMKNEEESDRGNSFCGLEKETLRQDSYGVLTHV